MRPLVKAVAAALAAAAVLPGQASGHAVLQHTTPHQNSTVTAPPPSVQLDFSEPVEVGLGAVRVYDQDGARVDDGRSSHPPGKPKSVWVGLEAALPKGIYTATYRVISADGHPVSGGFAFGVGTAVTAERDAPDVADLLARSSAGPVVEGLYGIVRGFHYAALLLLVGAVFFRLLVWRSRDGWPGRLLLATAVTGLVCSLLGVGLQGALGAGEGLGSIVEGKVLSGSLDTRTGEAWLYRAIAWSLLMVLLFLYRGGEPLATAIPAAAIVATLPWAGHAETQSPQGVLIPADVLHVLGAGAWLGGLVLLLACFWRRPETAGAAGATARFSRMALPAMLVVIAAGTAQAWFYLGSAGAFFDTTYGWALVAKIALLAVIVALAAANRRRIRDVAGGAVALRRAMRAEVALAALVLAATATLVRAAPPVALNSGPVIRELDLGPMRLQMDIEPGDTGPTDFHLYLFDRRTGAQIDRVEELTVRLVQPEKGIGPITLAIPRKGPAHYELRDAALGVAGTWQATVTARVSEFDEYAEKTTFKIRKKK